MRRAFLVLALGLASRVAAQPTPAATDEAQRDPDGRTSVTLSATLDPVEHRVAGRARIRWVNTSRVPQQELRWHLYLNAFADERTVFMQESGGQLRGEQAEDLSARPGGVELASLVLDPEGAAVDLLAASDDELVPGDRTQLRTPLPFPVPPGGTLELEAHFTSRLPRVFARSGFHGDFHCVAQWYPKLARLEPDGSWVSTPYHAYGEFYADFVDARLEVRTPPGWVVAATGVAPGPPEERSGERLHAFEAPRVHDVVFVAAPWLVETRRSVRGVGPGGASVEVQVFAPPGYDAAARRHHEVTAEGLRRFGERYGPYPYPTLSVVQPPRGAGGAAGMEYPMLFLAAGPWFSLPGMPLLLHDEVTAHELGHMWFQGLLASNEVAHPFLDEGVTEWVTGDFLRELHGPDASGGRLGAFRADGFELRRLFALRGPRPPPPAAGAPAFAGGPRSHYGRSVYGQTAVVLETVARRWGRARLQRTLGRYARRHRFAHPRPADFYRAFAEEYGSWMPRRVLRPALEGGALAAYAVSPPVREGDHTRLRGWRAGGLALSTSLALVHANGRRSRLRWPGSEARLDRRVAGDVVAVHANADRHGLLDPKAGDDAARRIGAETPRGSASLFGWLLLALETLGP